MPPARVPVLTEVVELPLRETAPSPLFDAAREASSSMPAAVPAAPARIADIDEAQLAQRILADVQRQVDLMLEYRLREALLPALARATDALVKDARHELASTLKDVVQRAVSLEMAKHRTR